MIKKEIENIIVNYLSRSASADEIIELTKWVNKKSNDLIFKDFLKINYLIDVNMIDFDTEKQKEEIWHKIDKKQKNIRMNRLFNTFKYAAVFIVALGLGYLYISNNSFEQTKKQTITETKIEPGTNKAILTLENGLEVALENDEEHNFKTSQVKGKNLVYDSIKISKNHPIEYNYLTIPRGGQFHVVLSDGTEVWLNSESQLKYPVAFNYDQARQVELVYGEAYFDVSPSTKHKGSKFIVLNQSQEIEVFGTKFNIKAYKDETNIYTTLVEGKVSVSTTLGNTQILVPNNQSNLDLQNKNFTIATIDVYNAIAWKDGMFSFDGMSLNNIMKTLSRWYDIEIVFENEALQYEEFIGVLSRDQEMEDILSIIKNFGIIKSYEINGKTIVLK